jgi:transcription elongation factor Elf1
VEIFRDEEKAIVSCGNCGAREEFPIKHALGEIDVYCMFTDKIYGGIRPPPASEVKASE